MAYAFTTDQLAEFSKKINYDVGSYLARFQTFVDKYYPLMQKYYNGKTSNLSPNATLALKTLTKESKRLEAEMILKYMNLDKLYQYRIVEFIDETVIKIQVFNKVSKFLKSSIFSVTEERSTGAIQIKGDNETFEDISSNRSSDSQNDWVDITLRNKISELDYKAQVGGITYVLGGRERKNVILTSVVDNLVGERLYGLDIKDTFEFENDDFKVLGYIDTFKQSIKNLAQLKKNDLFFLRDVGIPRDLLGSDLGSLALPFLAFELKRVFSIDDSVYAFTITNFNVEGTTFTFDFIARSYYDFITEEKAKLNN